MMAMVFMACWSSMRPFTEGWSGPGCPRGFSLLLDLFRLS
jgi:hypothetical protein